MLYGVIPILNTDTIRLKHCQTVNQSDFQNCNNDSIYVGVYLYTLIQNVN